MPGFIDDEDVPAAFFTGQAEGWRLGGAVSSDQLLSAFFQPTPPDATTRTHIISFDLNKESNPMSRMDDINARMAALEAEAAQLAFYGEDVYEEGTVLTFKAQFTEGGQVFSYVVLKGGGKWHSTSSRNKYMSWDELVSLLQRGHVKKVRMVTRTVKVIG